MMGDLIPFPTRTVRATRRQLDEFDTVVTTEAVSCRVAFYRAAVKER